MRTSKLCSPRASHRKAHITRADPTQYLRSWSLLAGSTHQSINLRIRDDGKLARRTVDCIAAKTDLVQFDDLPPKRVQVKLAVAGSRRE